MKNRRWGAALCAAMGLMLATASCVSASEIRIINEESESETDAPVISQGQVQGGAMTGDETEAESSRPLDPSAEGITADDAISGARTLYSQMQHYADVNDNTNFASLFEPGADAQTIQSQLQKVKNSLTELDGLDSHSDFCFFDPTSDTTQSPYYFAVALCDYDVDSDGAAAWYSTLMRLARYEEGWKASIMPAGELLTQILPQGFRDAQSAGRNSENLYPSFALSYRENTVFAGALYALPVLLWQEENGDVNCAVWVANGTQTAKWCDSIDLIANDKELGEVMAVNVPVQIALEGSQSSLAVCTVPANYVKTGTDAWTEVNVNSNLKYQ
ncbi:MAG: hypothetical protein IJ820_06945 [Lachnospiraceae bacterium]|nr:hypothetical protein [Lachnospiraceae bacterium]